MAKDERMRYMQTCGEVAPSLLISHHCQHHQVQRCANNYPKLEAIIEEGCHAHDESFQIGDLMIQVDLVRSPDRTAYQWSEGG
ncbi:hypothetical protein ACE6H2_022605 [Prunus campanulata]